MSFAASIGYGGKLEVETGAFDSGVWTDVGQVVDAGLNVNGGEVDITHQQSGVAAPFWEEWIAGAYDLEFPFVAVFDPGATEHEDSILDFIGVLRNYRYRFAQGQKWTFLGFYRNHNFSMPNESRLEADVTIRISGTPNFDATWA